MIKVSRNDAGNCINFVGTTNPAYWNACLSAEINDDNSNNINIINDIRTIDAGEPVYEFFDVPYTDFATKEGDAFADVQAAVDYITTNANVTGNTGSFLLSVTDTMDFQQDATTTSILFSNGDSYGVNTIKAENTGDGMVTIKQNADDGRVLYSGLVHTNVTINNSAVAGGLTDVINALNELFTVGPFQSIVITDPYSTMVADVGGTVAAYTIEGTTGVDPVGTDIFTNSGSGNYAGLKTTDTISEAGEYFTFDIRGEGQIGFGLIHSQTSYDAGNYSGTAAYADPTSFAVGNSAHYGFQFSHWFHPTPNGSWTNYGANTAYSVREHWSNWDKKQDWLDGNNVKVKVGIDANGFIEIATLNDDNTWGVHARTTYPVVDGVEFHLGIKASNSSARVSSAPKVHLVPATAPTMYFRYIESPDGNFEYPLFATEEEANYYDANHSGTTGSGTSHTHTYADDPTGTTWYMPDTGRIMNGATPPQDIAHTVFLGNTVTYTEITSQTNADLTPPQFSQTDMSREEGTAVNIQINPQGHSWSTTVDISPTGSGLVFNGTDILQGTLADVGADTDYTITVTRANSYGSSVGSFTLTATDVAPAQTSTTPFTKAVDFSGSSETLQNNNNSAWMSPMHPQNGNTVALPSTPVSYSAAGTGEGYTSNDTYSRPWATAVVFKPDYNNNNSQIIWNFGEGSQSWQKNTYLRVQNRGLYFGYHSSGSSKNECYIGSLGFTSDWFGVYIGFNGARFNSPTASDLLKTFDIRVASSSGSIAATTAWDFSKMYSQQFGSNLSTTGASMTSSMGSGRLNIASQVGGYEFHGKVASFVTTTLRTGVAMPNTTEIEMMVKDPLNWLTTYKDGQSYRLPSNLSDTTGFTVGSTVNYNNFGASTQVYLMGDGTTDSYSNGIRNQVNKTLSYSSAVLVSMVSSDIETVNIAGLT